MEGGKDRWIDGLEGRKERLMDAWIDGRKEGRKERKGQGRAGRGWMDRWMDG